MDLVICHTFEFPNITIDSISNSYDTDQYTQTVKLNSSPQTDSKVPSIMLHYTAASR